MMAAISSAIGSGQSAASSAISPPAIVAVAVVLTAVAIDALNQCYGIDVMAIITKWIKDKFTALKNKYFPDKEEKENPRITDIKNRIERIKAWIKGAIETIKGWIQWVTEKIEVIRAALNTPCARKATEALPAGTSVPTVPSIPST